MPDLGPNYMWQPDGTPESFWKKKTTADEKNKTKPKNMKNYTVVNKVFLSHVWERSGSVGECLTRDRGAAGSSLTGITALWSLSKTHLS